MPRLVRTSVDLPLIERLRVAIQAAKSVSLLARQIERTEGSIRNWCAGCSMPNAVDIKLLCQTLNVHPLWLLFGVGHRQLDNLSPDASQSRPKQFDEPLAEIVASVERELARAKIQPTAQQRAEYLTAVCKLFEEPR